MRAIFPGKPQSKPQALCTALWDGLRLIAYLSGNSVVILGGPQTILQTVSIDEFESLDAIAIEESSGKIAVCGDGHIYVYHPVGRDEGLLRWSQSHDLEPDSASSSTLSWGSSEELLVGGDKLCLWDVVENGKASILWEEKLANPVRIAQISHDAGLIASCGLHDRLVKIWRRLSYESDSTRFDVSYLHHPTSVTNLHWRKPWHSEQSLDNLLYTFCADNRIRVFAHSDPHSRAVMQFVAEIDMETSIQPRTPIDKSCKTRRFGFVLDSRDFSRATEEAVQRPVIHDSDHALEHLVEVASRSPEICVILDDQGHISAWGLENAGCKNRLPPATFNVVHVKGMGIPFPILNGPVEDNIRFCIFAGGTSPSSLTLLVHYFNGRIDWYDTQLAELFDPTPRQQRANLISSWTGHDAFVSKLRKIHSGNTMVSCVDSGQTILWKENKNGYGPLVEFSGLLKPSKTPHDEYRVCNLGETGFVVVINRAEMTLWDVTSQHFEKVAHSKVHMMAPVLQVFAVPTEVDSKFVVLSVSNDLTVVWWEICLPLVSGSNGHQDSRYRASVTRICDFAGYQQEPKTTIAAVSVYSALNVQPFSSRISVISVSQDGNIQKLSANMNVETRRGIWQVSSIADVCIDEPSLICINYSGKIAVVELDGTYLSIWNANDGQLEFEQQFNEHGAIKKLSWTSMTQEYPLLAIGFTYHIILLGQTPFNHHDSGPAWAKLYQIRIRDFATHALGDLCWLQQGNLVVSTGNQIFVCQEKIKAPQLYAQKLRLPETVVDSVGILDLVQSLNTLLPLFHPESLFQATILGKFDFVHQVLLKLHNIVKFSSQGDTVPSLLRLNVEQLHSSDLERHSSNKKRKAHAYSQSISETGDENDDWLTVKAAEILQDNLKTLAISQISQDEQSQLSNMAQIYARVGNHRQSVDDFAFRFLHTLSFREEMDQQPAAISSWREAVLAYHSTSQDILVDLVSQAFQGHLTWEAARRSGIFIWLSDSAAVLKQMEIVARNEYTRNEDRSPVACSLYYIALGKKNVLQGLWRMCVGNRERENTMKLLANDFAQPKWRTTALKNAYVLLSKRRFEYAAAFFLLGGGLKDAVNVCIHQIGQLELGIAIARVHEGDNGPVLRNLLTATILPLAAETGNRWMASWAFEMLGDPGKAVQAIVRPLHTLIPSDSADRQNSAAGTKASRSFRANEPGLVVLYKHLRAQLVKANKWVGVLELHEEWNFVMRCVRQYMRMGCDVLALDLVRNWEFVQQTPVAAEPKKDIVVQRWESAAMEGGKIDTDNKTEKKPKMKSAPTQFQEPSASSLLDSFGF